MSDSVAINFDTREFEEAMNEAPRLIRFADHRVITENAIKFVKHIVNHEFGHRTGNLRSSMIPVYRALGIPGTPKTNLKLGEKYATYNSKHVSTSKLTRQRTVRVFSNGIVNDRRTDPEKPSFNYSCFAAEWRQNYSYGDLGFVSKVFRSGLLSLADLKTISGVIARGNYDKIYDLLIGMLSSTTAGMTFMMTFPGKWKPYQMIRKGNHKNITAKFDFGRWHQKELDKIKGK